MGKKALQSSKAIMVENVSSDFATMVITPNRRQSKTLLTIDKSGSKSIETLFSIVGDKWQSKTLFLTIFLS